MRRVIALTTAFVLLPASVALGADLDELLERSGEASYSAEQIITCSTPDGVRDAVVRITQSAGEIRVGAPVDSDLSVASGYGGYTLLRGGDVVSSTAVEEATDEVVPRYVLDDGVPRVFLGRDATLYRMVGDGLVRAELLIDLEIGALLRVVTFDADGQVYCERRFISFDTSPAAVDVSDPVEIEPIQTSHAATDLPEALAGFTRLDLYSDDDGFIFAYYSDGFFSFAVFETPSVVQLSEPSTFEIDGESYDRSFTPGQVTFSWESRSGAMAMIGDLPPDMHQTVLDGLPDPHSPGLFRRLWRSLFG